MRLQKWVSLLHSRVPLPYETKDERGSGPAVRRVSVLAGETRSPSVGAQLWILTNSSRYRYERCRGGIHDASPPVKLTGVMNAASTSLWRYPLNLLIFIMAPKTHQPKREEEGEHSQSRVGAGYGKEWEADHTGEQRAATRAPTPLYSRPRPYARPRTFR